MTATGRDLPTRAPVIGAAAWLLTMSVAALGAGDLTLIDAMLLLAVLVIVPAAVPLHPAGDGTPPAVALLAGLPVAPALLIHQTAMAGVLAPPWLTAVGVGAVATLRWWWAAGRRIRDVVWGAAVAYLLVGAAWLLADRLGLEPAGFAAPFVQLTAIHFHYAGFTSVVLAGCAWRRCPQRPTAAAAAALTVAAPPIVAVGFTLLGPLQIAGAVLLAIGLWLLAWVTLRHIAPELTGRARVLLVVSSIATLAPMILAVQWAIGANHGTPALSIPDMVRAHGVVNAVGFALLGVLGWRLAQPAALRCERARQDGRMLRLTRNRLSGS